MRAPSDAKALPHSCRSVTVDNAIHPAFWDMGGAVRFFEGDGFADPILV